MAWLQCVRRKDGTRSYWIRDKRDGRIRVIAAGTSPGTTQAEAELMLDQYIIRRNLEKEGYDDQYAADLEEKSQ